MISNSWSSAAAHIAGRQDDLANVAALSGKIGDWAAFLCQETSVQEAESFGLHERTGKPLGTDEFIAHLEKMIGRRLRGEKPGPKKKNAIRYGVPGTHTRNSRGTRMSAIEK